MSDLNLLTPDLARASISDEEIVLDYQRVLEAIGQLATVGFAVTAWEGWLLYPDGSKGHSAQHQGTVYLQRSANEDAQHFVERAVDFARRTINQSQAEWEQQPEYPGATLYYCLSVEPCKVYQ
jgi:hypothetical protein